jgi:phage tail-like protein
MARSNQDDPVEKFRFSISVISINLSVSSALEDLGALSGNNTFARQSFAVIARAGFSEVTLPKANINEVPYRENIDNQRFSKGAGLVKYDPVVLRRGVTGSFDLYNWYREVNDDLALLATAQELTRDAKIAPTQSETFRKEVIITVFDRAGNPIKQWILFNAFPVAYKGGNDLSAQAEEKLVEEMTLTYESFLELEGGVSGFAKEIAKDALEGAAVTAISTQLPFLR